MRLVSHPQLPIRRTITIRIKETRHGGNAGVPTRFCDSPYDLGTSLRGVLAEVMNKLSSDLYSDDANKPIVPISPVTETVLSHVGHTPLIALNKIAAEEGVPCLLLAKCEFFSAGGSVKDRIALQMVEAAEREGKLSPGTNTIIEPTSGNMGIGVAMVAAVKGYRTIITLPDRMSSEKVRLMELLGARVIRTPSNVPWDSPESHIEVAKRLAKEIPGGVLLNQYENSSNPIAHEFGTALEIIQQLRTKPGRKVDVFVAGVGTGGTITGVARGLRKEWNDVHVLVP